tara:strand:- start:131 stop:1333 length:1203 start_codon:yes stop_codon:yes gene_type:complete
MSKKSPAKKTKVEKTKSALELLAEAELQEKVDKNPQVLRPMLKLSVKTYEEMQDLRKRIMNRIRNLVRKIDLNIPLNAVESKKEIEEFASDYEDAKLPGIIKRLQKEGKIKGVIYKNLLSFLVQVDEVLKVEIHWRNRIGMLVREEPIWKEYLEKIHGIGELLAAKLISRIGTCETFDSVSKLWAYFGYNLVCPTCTKEVPGKEDGTFKIIAVPTENDGLCPVCRHRCVAPKKRAGVALGFNAELRSIAYLIAECSMKSRTPILRDLYDTTIEEEKQKDLAGRSEKPSPFLIGRVVKGNVIGDSEDYDQDEDYFVNGDILKKIEAKMGKETPIPYTISKVNKHNRALRKVAKRFLALYYDACKTISGQEVPTSYVKEHMGHVEQMTHEEFLKTQPKVKVA